MWDCFPASFMPARATILTASWAPGPLVDLLASFYSSRRWFSASGAVHPVPVQASRGLLQGCPAYPALLNASMALWHACVRHGAPGVQLTLYLDDCTAFHSAP